ncbi:SseB family protein [Campylobacter suis]|uniref:SseB protein N-terminal domain-containing protein n=1 Tax=Campylobacter suis TaxID=2790657 RepID=A0ABM8Q6V0_9BACT|nr:SseB family protein [Campylobacter suis]CAD7288676.1 hypothetical protein LMG8286_01444 [Campylobacter suis]
MSLIEAIKNFKNTPDTQTEIKLIAELKKAQFLAPIILVAPLANPDGSAVFEEEGSNIKFALLQDDESGERFFPAFSSKDEMMKWRNDSEQEVINLQLKDYANMLLENTDKYSGVVVDAYSHSLTLNLDFFKALFKK